MMNSRKIRTVVLVFGMTLFFSQTSFGQSDRKDGKQKPPSFEQLIEEMDANKDGKLSKDEVKGPIKNDFSKIDTDEDGFITEEELEKAPKPKRGPKR